jgi:hypothetical protein
VQPTFAILDYKAYYDQFIDKQLVDKYSRMDFTQLYFKVQQPSRTSTAAQEGSAHPGSNLLVRTNYRKFGQEEYTVFLRENPTEEGGLASELPYKPVLLIISAWMPENATNAPCQFPETCSSNCPCRERVPGISFLSTVPIGRPQPMEFEMDDSTHFQYLLTKSIIISEDERKMFMQVIGIVLHHIRCRIQNQYMIM